jgi:hypothetical protein
VHISAATSGPLRLRNCCGFFFLLVFGLVFLVFCFVGGGLLPLLKVAAPERPDIWRKVLVE